jgi:hypothetical protein
MRVRQDTKQRTMQARDRQTRMNAPARRLPLVGVVVVVRVPGAVALRGE